MCQWLYFPSYKRSTLIHPMSVVLSTSHCITNAWNIIFGNTEELSFFSLSFSLPPSLSPSLPSFLPCITIYLFKIIQFSILILYFRKHLFGPIHCLPVRYGQPQESSLFGVGWNIDSLILEKGHRADHSLG